jgi:tRNA dimethylallyltransferase
MLGRVDPDAAAKLFERDYVRVIRALEVYFQTGHKISRRQPERIEPPEFVSRIRLYVLDPPREELYDLINRRTLAHFETGLVDEIRALREAGVPDNTNALGAHAYRRVCEYLRGERSLDSAIEKSQQDVRNYAKRQITWFKREPFAGWFKGFGTDSHVQKEVINAARNADSEKIL